mgnify:CR=1 FL=1
MLLGAFGFMFGSGGSALIAKTLGEGKKETVKQQVSTAKKADSGKIAEEVPAAKEAA